MTEELTKDQLAFLEECNLEYSERFTDADLEYKKIYDLGVPVPPIVYPWWGREANTRGRTSNRGRPGSSRYNDNYRDRGNNYREDNQRRPGSYSWYGASDGANRDEGNRRYNDGYRVRNRDQHREDNSQQKRHRQEHYRPY